ncbi:regulatory protein RecX [Conexibacter sp. DBS9H8]|uniref:regulatory protein RecX n=1 Tax=Conexibacter sp. DBS9H8 TaxID=2937801 RepID=UPI00200E1629|nr:regulatory protein RecX [Conexibacter sp. DBS9H8]
MPDALSIAYALVNRRERTVTEVRARLERAGCAEAEIAAAILELETIGFLDDARYARLFVEDRRNLDGWGNARIERALRERGVHESAVGTALAGAGEESESARALGLLARRPQPDPDDLRARERAFTMLLRKGYESELAGRVVRAWMRGEGPDG